MKTKPDISQPDRLYASLNRFIATTDEYIESLEASYHLWPNKSILRALESLRKEREK